MSGNGFGNGFSSTLGWDGFGSGFYGPTNLILTGLVLRYEIADSVSYPGSGITVTDLQGNSNATLVNDPAYSDGYLTFDGVNDYLMTSTSLASKVATDITSISMWAYPMDNGVLLSERGEASLDSGWHDSQMEMVGGTMKFGMWNGAGISTITSTIATPLNAWYNFTIVYDGTKLIAYVNGSSAGTVTFARENPVEGGVGIHYAIAGEDSTDMGDGGYANMRLGQFLVYNRALTESEVLQNFNVTKGRYGL
jgi:Concanavalin A-like lectin/glucanases superfamily